MAPSAARGSRTGSRPVLARGRALRWAVLRHRRRLALVCGLCAAAATVFTLRPAEPDYVAVLTAAHDLAATDAVDGSAVAVRSVPPEFVPEGALPADTDLSGRRLNAPVGRGEILTAARLSDPVAAEYGTGLVAAPVRVGDPGVRALVSPGTRIDILAASDGAPSDHWGLGPVTGEAAVIARDSPVMAVPDTDAAAGSEALLLVAVTEEEARRLAASGAYGHLSITIRGD